MTTSDRHPHVELRNQSLMISRLDVSGPAFDAVRTSVARGEDAEIVVRAILNVGGEILLHAASQATVDSVSAEVDRLIDAMVTAAAKDLPRSLEQTLQQLQEILAEYFDTNRTHSIQHQLVEAFEAASINQQRSLAGTLVDDHGPLGLLKAELAGMLQLMISRHDDLLTKISAVSEQISGAATLRTERERSPRKGFTYEQALIERLESAFSPFQDVVEPTGQALGSDKNKRGDCVVCLNPKDTGELDVRIVVEAKDRSLGIRQTLDELNQAMSNREAIVGIIVFAAAEHAPLQGLPMRVYPGNRIVAVFDPDHGGSLPLDVACQLTRGLAIAGLNQTSPNLAGIQIAEDLDRLTAVLEDARSIKRGLKAAYRGLDQANAGYEQIRRNAFAVTAEIQNKLIEKAQLQ